MGWGLQGESFAALSSLGRLGRETWFRLGDQDLATHIVRTEMLKSGLSLSEVTRHVCRSLGVSHPVAPMSDQRLRTVVLTESGEFTFQTYFVKLRCEPRAAGVRFEGAGGRAGVTRVFRSSRQRRTYW